MTKVEMAEHSIYSKIANYTSIFQVYYPLLFLISSDHL